METIITLENRDVFPTKHLSISAIRTFLENEQDFYKKYVRLEFDNVT